jgi:5-formyltetrahydrofolate cyclo-ligase
MDDLEPGYFGVLEPKTCKPIEETNNSLVIVPGLVFDLDLNRIGYGKGFYDRYFQKSETMGNSLVKCGITYDMQICDGIEADTYDRHLDIIVTEKRIIR